MSSYNYPASENAKGTHLQSDLVESIDTIEEYIFRKVRSITGDPAGTIVDIGAGEGRYSVYFGSKAERIELIEPDSRRLRRAQEATSALGAKVTGIQGTVEDAKIAERSANLVLNVHVLQHIHPDAAQATLEKASEWLKPGGMLVLCFTKKCKVDRDYNLSWKEKGEGMYGPVPKVIFELAAKQPIEGVLPVRKIRIEEVKKTLDELGFDLLYEEEYSPRLVDLEKSRFSGPVLFAYKLINPILLHKALSLVGYSKFEDLCLVAKTR